MSTRANRKSVYAVGACSIYIFNSRDRAQLMTARCARRGESDDNTHGAARVQSCGSSSSSLAIYSANKCQNYGAIRLVGKLVWPMLAAFFVYVTDIIYV